MRIIIIGCGRMGSGLAENLALRGHAVTVVDKDAAALEHLGAAFKGQQVVGIGIDRDVLLQAGVERADGLATVTNSDETNVIAARVARQVFHVPRVVARLFDPRKAEIYRRLGLQTISTTTWGISRIADLICYSPLETLLSLGSGEVELLETEIPAMLAGRQVNELTSLTEIHVVAIKRNNRTFLPTLGTAFQVGDVVILAVLADATDRLKSLLGWG
ncbi:MAG: potassium transporter TrkA [Chloroflexi bacterium]|nr:potassium transporter TrkA [Chloroflexota bacterium]